MGATAPGLAEHGLEDPVGVDLLFGEALEQAAVTDHDDTAAQADELFQLAGQEHHRMALRGKVSQMVVELTLGLCVDAASRVVQDQDMRLLGKGAAEQHLLLVAAAERSDLVGLPADLDGQAFDEPVEDGRKAGPYDDAGPAVLDVLAIKRDQEVLEDAEIREDALAAPVAGDVGDAASLRCFQAVDLDQRPCLGPGQRQALESGRDTGHGPHQLVLALPVESGHTHDLAAQEVEVDPLGLGPDPESVGAHDDLVAERLVRFAVLGLRHVPAAGHQAKQVLLGDLLLLQYAYVAAVAHDGGAVADADQFGDAVGDDDDRGPHVAQRAHPVEEPFGGIQIESRRRFVQDQHPWLHEKGATDGDPLFDGERQPPGVHLRIDLQPRQLLHQHPGRVGLLPGRPRLREETVRAHEQVVGHGTVVGDQDLLENGGDPGAARLDRGARRMAEDGDPSGIGQDDGRHHLGERGFATAVTADDGVDLAASGAEGAAVERPGHPVDLVDVGDGDGIPRRRRRRRGMNGGAFVAGLLQRVAIRGVVRPLGRGRTGALDHAARRCRQWSEAL